MTELTGAQVREIQWASSDDGKAQLRAAWQVAVRFGLNLAMSDVGAMLWAAREAHVPEQAAGIVTVLAGCMYCHRVIADTGRVPDPWRTLPDREEGGAVLFPVAAARCSASPDDAHHPPAGA